MLEVFFGGRADHLDGRGEFRASRDEKVVRGVLEASGLFLGPWPFSASRGAERPTTRCRTGET